MSKISELSDGGSLQSTDYLIAVRSGGNVKVRPNGAVSGTTGQFSTSLNVDGTVTADGLTSSGNIFLDGSGNPTVINKTSGAGNNPLYRLQADTNYWDMLGVFSDADNTFRIRYNNTDALKIANNGDISFYEDTGTTPKFFWDASAEALQLKSGSLLELERPDGAISSKIYMQAGASGGLAFDNLNGDGFEFKYAGADQVVIDSAGNVGIGFTIPNATLAFGGNSDVAFNTSLGSTGTYGQIKAFNTLAPSNPATNIRFIRDVASVGNDGAICFDTVNTERMRIDSSGRLLVGTASNYGGEALQIDANSVGATVYTAYISNTNTSTSAYNVMRWAQGAAGSATGMIGTGGSATGNVAFRNSFVVGTQSSSPLVFATGDAERARIDSSGNLLVGTTTSSSPASGVVITPSFTSADASGIAISHPSGTSSGAVYGYFFYNSTGIGSITQNGTTGVLYNTSSDYRLKDVDGPITNSGAYIDALKPVQGSWKADGSRFIGLIAHEVQEVSETQIATGEKDGEEMQGMDYSAPELIANLIAEIQSLRARVAQLEGA